MGAWGSSILFPGAATLECYHCRWAHLRFTLDRGDTEWCRAWDCQHHTGATPFLAIKPHMTSLVLNQHLQGALEWLQWTSPTTSAPASQHNMPRRKLLSVALGALPSSRAEDPLDLEGMDLAIPDPMATSSQVSLGEVMPEHVPSIVQISHSPSPPAISKLQMWPAFPPVHSLKLPPGPIQPTCLMRCFECKGRWMQPWSGCSWPRPPWTPAKGSWHGMPTSSCAKMRPRLPKPSKRRRSAVQLSLGRQRPVVKSWSRRQKPAMVHKLTLWNNPMRNVCQSWSVKH